MAVFTIALQKRSARAGPSDDPANRHFAIAPISCFGGTAIFCMKNPKVRCFLF
jgi:hypothetical protein